jgi:ATP-dependent DNA helicase RecG
MKIAQLKRLVDQGESATLEFKNSTASISTGMQTVCAFLNSEKGGTILFGVKDDGKIVGQEVSDKTKKEIAVELNKIEPYAQIDVIFVPVADRRQVIVIQALPGDKTPYTYDGRAFMRNQSTTMRMSHDVYTYLYNKSNPTLWESLTNNNCTIKDLDKTRIKEVLRVAAFEKRLPEGAQSGNTTSVLKKLGLIVDDKLTNAAVILFCKDEYKQFMQSTLKLARFKGTTKSEFLNQKMIRANAFDLYDKAMDFLTFSLPVAAKIEPGISARVETPAIPYNVLREALINALVHRDYSHPGTSIDVAMYDDRVTITNPGFLPQGVNIKQLSRDHKSIQRNPLIAHVFYLCGKIEKWGRGTLDMIKDCKKAGNPLPKFEEIGGGFSVTLPLKEPMRTVIYEKPEKIDLSRITTRQQKILLALRQGPLNRQQIMNKLRTQVTDRTLQTDLGKLKDLGLVKSEGKSKATLWYLIIS